MIKPGILTGNRYFESHCANKVTLVVQKLSKDFVLCRQLLRCKIRQVINHITLIL